MSKGGSLFCRAAYLEQESRRIFRELEQEQYLKQAADGLVERFAERLAHYQALAEGATGLNAYVEASILCVQRADSSKLRQIILQGLRRTGAA